MNDMLIYGRLDTKSLRVYWFCAKEHEGLVYSLAIIGGLEKYEVHDRRF